MKRKRNIQTSALLLFRRLGMLCKLPRDQKPTLRIARTVYPAERVTSIESEQHVWIQTKLISRPNCKFDANTGKCPCGAASIEEFALNCNSNK
jgi:hypothetical protein